MFSSFKQQSSQWQQVFAKQRNAGPVQRIFAWLMLGIMLFIGLAILVFMLLLSWILIPIFLIRHRSKMKQWQQQHQASAQKHEGAGDSNYVIEGEVLRKRED